MNPDWWRAQSEATYQDIRYSYLLFLGRAVDSASEVLSHRGEEFYDLVQHILMGKEFSTEILSSILLGGFATGNRFEGRFSGKLLAWLTLKFPTEESSLVEFLDCATIGQAHAVLFRDEIFGRWLNSMSRNSALQTYRAAIKARPSSIAMADDSFIIQANTVTKIPDLIYFHLAQSPGDDFAVDLIQENREMLAERSQKIFPDSSDGFSSNEKQSLYQIHSFEHLDAGIYQIDFFSRVKCSTHDEARDSLLISYRSRSDQTVVTLAEVIYSRGQAQCRGLLINHTNLSPGEIGCFTLNSSFALAQSSFHRLHPIPEANYD